MTRTVKSADDYLSRVLKHIPSEIVMAYIAIDGVLRTSYNPNVWSERQTQLFISTLSVPVWLFALGGSFTLQAWYEPAFGAIVLPIYTLIVPIISRSAR